MNKHINYKHLNTLIIIAIAYLMFLMKDVWLGVVAKIFNIILPFLIAFIIAYTLYPLLEFLMKKKFPKVLAISIIIITLCLFVGIVCYFALPLFFNQLINLLSSLGKVSSDLALKYNIDMNLINDFLSNSTEKIIAMISSFISDGSIIGIISKSVDYITKFVIIFIVSIYFLSDMSNLRGKFGEYLYKTNKKRYFIISNIDKECYSYLKGLCIFILIQFFEYTLAFLIIGHPNFLLIGILASITTVIPYFGGLATNILALIIASVISPKLFILTLILTIVLPNIDGYVISPKIYGKTNQLPALLSIFAVTTGGALFGFAGIIIALPVTIIIIAIYKSYKKEINIKITNIKEKKKK